MVRVPTSGTESRSQRGDPNPGRETSKVVGSSTSRRRLRREVWDWSNG